MSRPIPLPPGDLPEAAEIQGLIARGNSKSAVEAAKLVHKRVNTAVSERLLVDAYAARIRSMLDHRMAAEADALAAMVRQRYPASAARLDAVRAAMNAAGAGLEAMLGALSDPSATPQARAAAETFVRKEVTEPGSLARTPSLRADHPLRLAASALQRAFDAVTSGPVEESALALPEISRRSPLAPWKPLLRAIGAFYRKDDAACLENLKLIEPGSAPARLAPQVQAMLAAGSADKSKPDPDSLAAHVVSGLEELRRALADLDREFDAESWKPKRILDGIRRAAGLAQKECPEILPALRRQVAVLAMRSDMDPGPVIGALGGAPKTDARYFLALARVMEADEEPVMACQCWEFFRNAALKEGWFPAHGQEMGTLYAHMAEVAGRIDPEDIEMEYRASREFARSNASEGFAPIDAGLPHLHAEWLFEQACAMDPCADHFERWADWAKERGDSAGAEAAAGAWRKALPDDPRPLLRLMRAAEDRDALKKALGYLRQAEALDGVSTEVRRARLRLLLLGAMRHLKQRKPRLATGELEELEALPQARENDRPAFLAALRHVYWTLSGSGEKAQEAAGEVRSLLGSRRAEALAVSAAAFLCDVKLPVEKELEGSWMEAFMRVYGMLDDLGFHLSVAREWESEILQELKQVRSPEPGLLLRLVDIASRAGWEGVALAATGKGLAAGGPSLARFLLLRARALPDYDDQRRINCAQAAFTLAERRNDAELRGEISNFWRETTLVGSLGLGPQTVSDKQIKRTIDQELRARKERGGAEWDPFPEIGLTFPPRRRPRRRSTPPIEEDWLF